MSEQRYKAGDVVELTGGFANQPRPGAFEVLRVMPERDNKEGQYRVRGPDGLERAVGHHEILEPARPDRTAQADLAADARAQDDPVQD
jgi:hypothetical protein